MAFKRRTAWEYYGVSDTLNPVIKGRRSRIVALVAVAAVVAVFVTLNLTICKPLTVVGSGTTVIIPPQQHVQYLFTRPPNSEGATYGYFSADHGATLYVMTAAQFNNYISGAPSSFIYSTGQVGSGGLGGRSSYAYIKPPGQYYFMFYNAGGLITTVTITSDLAVETC